MKAELRTEEGDLVREVDIPETKKGTEAVVLGKKVFVRRDCYKMTGSMIYTETQAVFLKD